MVYRAINDKFDWRELKELNFLVQKTRKIMMLLSYHLSHLSLIALEAMRLLLQILHHNNTKFWAKNKILWFFMVGTRKL